MTLFSTIFAFVIALGLLITFHEFGHYLVARWCGVKVLRFSLGFGRPLLKNALGVIRRNGWSPQFRWGYVKMLDEREGPVPADELSRAFNRQSVSRRLAIVIAGPAANFYWPFCCIGYFLYLASVA